ncbi:MAG: hypothetical protein F4Y45_09195 [Acidobacteria bacterium]|nr:hypothetical protein [Acidobacteriota bacterium]MYD69920.1 hypothetical protein [Acidobacteriota bacterium]MYJ05313.1 hypothetical protein [Acidobacteriota bacterium]
MTDSAWTFARRVVTEKRVAVSAVAILLAVDAGLWGFAVYPWTVKLANAEQRASGAAAALAVAEQRLASSTAAADGLTRVDTELRTFRSSLLPSDLPGARAIAFSRLASLVDMHGLMMERRASEIDTDATSSLERLRVSMVVQGVYRDLRQFIAAVEALPEFLVIEEILLSGGEDVEGMQVLTLGLATYYLNATAEGNDDATPAQP